jgi:hypothetical protein
MQAITVSVSSSSILLEDLTDFLMLEDGTSSLLLETSAGPAFDVYTRWVRFDDFAPSNISIQCDVFGAVIYTVQSTLDDPNDPFNPVSVSDVVWVDSSDTNVVNAIATQQSNFLFAPKYARIKLNGDSLGSVTATFLQSSNGPI